MKKISKSKGGFTLIEMVLVIAIIVILASFLYLSVISYLDKANTVTVIFDSRNSINDSLSEVISSYTA